MGRKLSNDWLKTADRDPALCLFLQVGLQPFLVAHDVPRDVFENAARRGNYVSVVSEALNNVGRAVRSDRIGGRHDDIKVVDFWQREIERHKQRPAKQELND